MAYQLRREKKKGDIYLKIYYNFRDPETKKPRAQFVKSLGYVSKLKAEGISDPISHYLNVVQDMNDSINFFVQEQKAKEIAEEADLTRLGYFPLMSILKKLDVQEDVESLTTGRRFMYPLYDCLCSLIYARVVDPCSKKRTVEKVLPNLWHKYDFNYDTVRSCLEFIGLHYQKIIEIFTHHVRQEYVIDTSTTLFDCTNFYFEIDKEDKIRRKGPSKENRSDPIYGMGLLLDANAIPISMRLYPGNQSEMPLLRTMIKELKMENNIVGRTVQVADKGLNCAANIIAAVQDGDGYIFSKSIKKLSETELTWVLLNDGWQEFYNDKGELSFKIKSCIDKFTYTNSVKGSKRKDKVTVNEMRVVTYNPKLAKKQQTEIEKLVGKAETLSLSQAKKNEYGEAAKYMTFVSLDSEGEVTNEKAAAFLNREKINKDLSLCGYNMIVTSEINQEPKKIYDTYHELWKIEESFRCVKSNLDARPVYLQDEYRINGHFLICYLAVLLERIFQFKILENEFSSEAVYDFFKSFNWTVTNDGTYKNISPRSPLVEWLSARYALPILHMYLKTTQIEKVLSKRL